MRRHRVAGGAAAGKRLGLVLSASTRRFFVCLAPAPSRCLSTRGFPDGPVQAAQKICRPTALPFPR